MSRPSACDEIVLALASVKLAAAGARRAHREGGTLKQAAIALGYVTGEDFDRWVIPAEMVHSGTGT